MEKQERERKRERERERERDRGRETTAAHGREIKVYESETIRQCTVGSVDK